MQVCQQQAGETRLALTDVSTTFLVVIIGCSAALGLFLLERAIAEATLLLKEARSWWRVRGESNKMNKVEKVNKLVAARGASNNCSGSGSA